jgi:hypothetical protein
MKLALFVMIGPFDASAWVAKRARTAMRRVARMGRSLRNMTDEMKKSQLERD